MTQLETIAVLLNGGHVIWHRPSKPGPSYYAVVLPSRSDDRPVGWLTDRMASDLFEAGFLTVSESGVLRDDGYTLTVLKLGSPVLSFLDKHRKKSRGADK